MRRPRGGGADDVPKHLSSICLRGRMRLDKVAAGADPGDCGQREKEVVEFITHTHTETSFYFPATRTGCTILLYRTRYSNSKYISAFKKK